MSTRLFAAFPRSRYLEAGVAGTVVDQLQAEWDTWPAAVQVDQAERLATLTKTGLFAEVLVSTATALQVLAWVGTDARRATAAYLAEVRGQQRQTLLDDLAAISDDVDLPALIPSPFVRISDRGAPGGVAALSPTGDVVDADGVRLPTEQDLAAALLTVATTTYVDDAAAAAQASAAAGDAALADQLDDLADDLGNVGTTIDAGIASATADGRIISATGAAAAFLAKTARGAASGVAALDSSTKVPLAQVPDLGGTYDRASFPAEGVPLWAYGNSWATAAAHGGLASMSWPTRVGPRLRSTVTNRAIGGSVMPHVWYEAANDVSSGGRAWTPGGKGIVLLEEVINDVVTFGGTSVAKDAYRRSVQALLELFRSSSRLAADNAAFTYSTSPAWTGGNAFMLNGGKRTATVGATISFTFTGTGCTLIFYANSGAAGTVRVNEGATVLATANLSTAGPSYTPPGGGTVGLTVYPIRLSGLSAGAHTITVTTTVAGDVRFDGVMFPGSTPPQVLIVREPEINSYAPNGSVSIHADYSAILDQVAAEAAYAAFTTVVDPAPGWNKATMLNLGDGIGNHPNDRGSLHLADAVVADAQLLPLRAGMNIL